MKRIHKNQEINYATGLVLDLEVNVHIVVDNVLFIVAFQTGMLTY